MQNRSYICPVCGYPELEDPPRQGPGIGGSYEICSSCGFEFGVTDDDLGYTYESWRERWVAPGMPWDGGGNEGSPEGWDPVAQLRAVTPG